MRLLFILIVLTVVYCDDYFYVYARQWPPTSCLSTTCNYYQNWSESTLNVHGLWLNYGPLQSCNYPSKCLNIAFDPASLSSATNTSLKINWVGVFNSSSTFHNHEWTKHGTCYEKQITGFKNIESRFLQVQADSHQDIYFSLGCSLNQKYNIMKLLKDKGVIPSKTVGHDVNTLYSDINTNTKNSLLTCKLISGNYYLMSYYICLDKSWNIINCPCPLTVQSGSVPCPIDHPIYIVPK